VDLVFDGVERSSERHLLLCTNGVRTTGLFQRDERWRGVERAIVLPEDQEQEAVHNMIYDIKLHGQIAPHLAFLEQLMRSHGVRSYIAGCTEIHILARRHEKACQVDRGTFCIDPLAAAASIICGHGSPLVRVA
jgi:aspartate racemase